MFVSVEAVRWVLTRSESERSARLVFIAVAAHCNEDGYCWPSLDTIMRYSKLSKSVVLEALQKLYDVGEMTVEKGGHGAADTNRYYMKAFMESRVGKGLEIPDKGMEIPEKGYTRVDTNKNLEQEVLEQAGEVSPERKEKLRELNQRLDDYYNRRWQTDSDGRRYLISPSTGVRVYEESF